jgi:hypothetical protein
MINDYLDWACGGDELSGPADWFLFAWISPLA